MSTCEHCYEHTEGGPEWLIPVEDKRVCQACADLLREAAHEKLQQELEASVEFEKVKRERDSYRFALSWIGGYTRRALNLGDPRLREIGEFCTEVLYPEKSGADLRPCDSEAAE